MVQVELNNTYINIGANNAVKIMNKQKKNTANSGNINIYLVLK
jgi:hypothetical protein